MRYGNKNGFVLLTLVVMIIVSSVAVLAVSQFVFQSLSLTQTKKIKSQSLDVAHAGIHSALYNFRNNDLAGNGYFSLGQTNIDAENQFVLGGTASDLFMVDLTNAILGGQLTPDECKVIGDACRDACVTEGEMCQDACQFEEDECIDACPPGQGHGQCVKDCRHAGKDCSDICKDEEKQCKEECKDAQKDCVKGDKLTGIDLQNATNSQTSLIDRMIVTWDNNNRLRKIRINGVNIWSGNLSSPANADVADFTLDTVPSIYPIDHLEWDKSMASATSVSVQFIMTDGTSKTVPAFPSSNSNNFTVNSTGKTNNQNVYKTIVSEYNARTGKIIRYDESITQVSP